MLEKANCLADWSNRELTNLAKGLEKLHAKQPRKTVIERPTLKGCQYHKYHGVYIVNIVKGDKRIYAGRLQQWDRGKALELQKQAEEKWEIQQKTISQKTN